MEKGEPLIPNLVMVKLAVPGGTKRYLNKGMVCPKSSYTNFDKVYKEDF